MSLVYEMCRIGKSMEVAIGAGRKKELVWYMVSFYCDQNILETVEMIVSIVLMLKFAI